MSAVPSDEYKPKGLKIGLALSGGGSRAIAFHLGCLRALHELGLLQRVSVISTVSGGSVIGAAYGLYSGDFGSFESGMRQLLRTGLAVPIAKKLFGPAGAKALSSLAISSVPATALFAASKLAKAASWGSPAWLKPRLDLSRVRSPVRRFASRTTLLEAALDDLLFKGAMVEEFGREKPPVIVNATELRTGSAFRFGAAESGSWRWGRIARNDVTVAHAVAASAAYPMFLPAFDDRYAFEKGGKIELQRVLLSDGGVYDNLGLGPLWPGRSPEVSLNVLKVDAIICCSAGYGLRQDPPSQFFAARMNSAFCTTFERAQNAAIDRLHQVANSGEIKWMLFPYLGQRDDRLPSRPEGLVPRERAHAYPTNFNSMPKEWIERLSLRGYQLTKLLARSYLAGMLTN